MKNSLVALCLLAIATYAKPILAQKPADIIHLDNPSFEDMPIAGRAPTGWLDYGPVSETPPDVQPYGGFRVTKAAFHGNTYIGLVTRDHNTWESVGQKLSKPMKKDQCYDFSFVATRSEIYESATKHNQMKTVNFNKAVTVRIFGGVTAGERSELLAVSELIESSEWQTYKLQFKPSNDYNYIIIEAYYKTPTLFPYNGNVMIDNLSPLTPCNLQLEEPVVADKPVTTTPSKPNPTTPTNNTPVVTKVDTPISKPTPAPSVQKEERVNFSSNIKTQELKVGDIFRLSNLYFAADSSNVTKVSENALMELFTFLKNNPNITVEIGGHTNGLPTHEYCDRLSTERAQKVADFLINKGLPNWQIQAKGYGKRKPIDSDATPAGREKNQRVEIKILGIK